MVEHLEIRKQQALRRFFATASPAQIYSVDAEMIEKLRVAANRNGRHCFAVKVDGCQFLCWLPLNKDHL